MKGLMRFAQGGCGLLAVMAVLAGPAMAQMPPPPLENTITTQGQGEVHVKPDSLNVSLSVESRAATLDKARSDNSRKMQAVIQAVKALNIPNLTLETSGVNIYPVQGEYQRNQAPKIVGYQATNSLSVNVRRAGRDELAAYGSRIMDAALNAGANNVGGLNFYLDDLGSAQGQALQEAVRDARRNAEAMAQAAGVTLKGVSSIEGQPQFGGGYPRPVPMMSYKAAEAAEAPPTPVEAGETTVTSTVMVRYRF